MATIRELVAAISQRDGVDATILLGRDGLLIDGRAASASDLEALAAHVPPIVAAAEELARGAGRGNLVTAVLEYDGGIALVSVLSSDATLLVLAHAGANVGPLLYDLRRHRGNIASIV
jgi:predicted regulator of Ras-like GTPase activity (Roadblock/LC7/MglB family)